MQKPVVRVLVAAVGLYAITRAVGQLREHLQALELLVFSARPHEAVWDLVSAVALVAPLLLLAVGLVLLLGPPRRLRERIEAGTSLHEALGRTAGLFIAVVGLEQFQALGAAVGRLVKGALHVSVFWGSGIAAFAVLMPLSLVVFGLYLLCARSKAGGKPTELSEVAVWEVVSMFTGAVVLSRALPRLTEVVSFHSLHFRRGLHEISHYIVSSHRANVLTFLLEVAIATYLLVGAPRLAAWHARRSASRRTPGSPAQGEGEL